MFMGSWVNNGSTVSKTIELDWVPTCLIIDTVKWYNNALPWHLVIQ